MSTTQKKSILTHVTENRLLSLYMIQYPYQLKNLCITKKMTNASVKEKSNGFKEASHKIFYDYFWLLNNHGNENKMEYYLIRIALVRRMILCRIN